MEQQSPTITNAFRSGSQLYPRYHFIEERLCSATRKHMTNGTILWSP
jgi:hypothetical protein